MDHDILATLFNPGILFFLLGVIAKLLRSNLEIPDPIVKFVSLYLMLSIGFKGGVSLYHAPLFGDGLLVIGFILAMSALVPVASFAALRARFGAADAAAIGATFGSNSTLTYITAVGFLTSLGVAYGGYMTVALVVMETPATILSILLARAFGGQGEGGQTGGPARLRAVMRSALTDGTVIVLVGSLVIGYLLVALGEEASPLAAFISGDMFTGLLIFFLMYMGLQVGGQIRGMRGFPPLLVVYALAVPMVNGALAFGFSRAVGLQPGDAYLLILLCASASYIVAPVLLREGLPEANPARYLTMSMAIAFPLNIVVGIPAWWWLVNL